jgi:hypothetical protein
MKMTDFLKYLLMICFLFLIPMRLLSQDSYFYEKGTYSEKIGAIYFKNVLKTDLVSLAFGDLSLLYEHRFSDKFGLEGGAGFLLQPTKYTLMSLVHVKPFDNFKSNAGFSLMVVPRFYIWDNAVHFPFFRFRQYEHLTTSEIGYGAGYTFYPSKRIFAETSLSAALLFQSPSGGYPLLYEWNPNPLSSNNQVIFEINLSLVIGLNISKQ